MRSSPRDCFYFYFYFSKFRLRIVRGVSPASICSASFSLDSNWLSLTSNHGTTHFFVLNEEMIGSKSGSYSFGTHTNVNMTEKRATSISAVYRLHNVCLFRAFVLI